MANPKMNMRGPNGGKGAPSQASVRGSTVRPANILARAQSQRGDVAKGRNRNLDGQKPVYSRIAKVKQAAVNKGAFTDFSVSRQNLTQTKRPTPSNGRYATQQGGQPRGISNTMSGKGKAAG